MRYWRVELILPIVLLVAACGQPVAPVRTALVPAPTLTPTTALSVTTSRPRPTDIASTVPPTNQPATAPRPSPALPTYDLVLRGGTLIDGSGGQPLPNAAVAIRAGRVVAVGPAAMLSFSPETPVRELAGTTFLPGFVNAHAHTWELTDDQLRGWTRAGVTTVRDLSGPRDLLVARRDKLTSGGDATLPRLRVAGPMVTVWDGHPIPIYGESDRVLAVRGPADAAAQITALLDGGVDLIKIAVSGRTDTNWPELSDAEIRAITDTAHARGARVSAHVDRAIALRRAVLNGIDDAAHMPRDHMPDDLIAEMVARRVVLVPTIDVYEGLAEERGNADEWRRTILPVMADNLRRFSAAGGILALGDDYGNPRVALGMPMPEIEHWLAAGLTPMQVIVAATHGGAAVCGLEQEIGQLRPGMAADVLVVDGDPLTDLRVLERVILVLRAGTIVSEG